MKKNILTFILLISILFLTSCGGFSYVINNKKEILSDKYGDIIYLYEKVFIYNNLKDDFVYNDDIKYIINNKGDRGSVEPSFKENLYLLFDVIKYNDEYKLILYDNVSKKNSNKTKMFYMTHYNLIVGIDDIKTLLIDNLIDMNISDHNLFYIKKDSNIESNPLNKDFISIYFYNLEDEGSIILQLYNYITGDLIITNGINYIIGNEKLKTIYYPNDLSYSDII